jgi:hypothetical protein
MEVGLYERMME